MSSAANIKKLETTLLDALTREFSEFGFSARLSRQEFILTTPSAVSIAHIEFVPHKDDVDATLDIGVRLAAIEEMMKRAGWPSKNSATIGAEMGNLVDGRPRRWTIRTEDEAARVAAEMIEDFTKFGLDWLRRFSRLESVFELLSTNDRRSWLVAPIHAKRCAILLTLAVLLRNSNEAIAMASECRTFLALRNDQQQNVFDEFSGRLLALE